jgi:membrane-bound serine protease (ClpP class)
LRPAGFATFDKKRVDVVTQGEMIAKGERVRVVDVKGNRIIVAVTKKV